MKKSKKFDCVKMKLYIQKKLYKETENLSLMEFVKYIHNDIKNSDLMQYFNKRKQTV